MSVYYADITELVKDLQAAPGKVAVRREDVLDQVSNELLGDQLAHVPVRSGNLRGTLHVQTRPGWRKIGTDHMAAEYDIFVEFGTKPHVIEAPAGGVLAFRMNGQLIMTKRVNHPGTRAQPFVANSMRRWQETLGEKMALIGQEAIIRG